MRSAPRILSRVIGRSFIRRPMALKIALPTAAGDRHDARFAHALRPVRPVAVVGLDEDDFDLRRVAMRRDALAVVAGRQRLAAAAVVEQILVQRHADAHGSRAPLIWLVAVSGFMMRPQSCTATYFVTRTWPSSVSTSTSTKCAPKALRTLPSARVGFGVADAIEDVARRSAAPFSAICFFRSRAASIDRVAGHDRRAAARFADRVRTAIGVAPDDLHLRERHAELLGRDQPHRRLRAGADVGDADEARVYCPSRRRWMTALLRPRPERNAMNDMPAPRLIGPAIRSRLADASASSSRTPRRRGGCTRRACSWCTASVSRGLPRHVLQDELDRIHLQLVRRRRPSSTGCRRSPAETRGRGSSPTPSCSCRPGEIVVSMFAH